MGHARALLKLEENEQIELAEIIVAKKLNVREAEKLAKRLKTPTTTRAPRDPSLGERANALSRLLEKKLSHQVKIICNEKGEGSIRIKFDSLDEVDWLTTHLEIT